MSTQISIHVGPYAEVLVPRNEACWPDQLLEPGEQWSMGSNLEKPPPVLTDGAGFVRVCYMPYFVEEMTRSELRPPRQMSWGADYWTDEFASVVELTEGDIRAETAWFEGTYAEFLGLLSSVYAPRAVRVCWGIVPSF
jgi:hypothetical protein